MRYFITGGAGFIGSNFVELLLSQSEYGVELVTAYDKLTYSGNIKNLEKHQNNSKFSFIQGNTCNLKFLKEKMIGHDIVVHFAAESHVDTSISHASRFVETNVLGTQLVLEASLTLGVQRVINISTDEVYGSIAFGSSNENSLLAPNSPYSASKASADMISRAYYKTHNLDVVTTRSVNNYGKFQHVEKLIPLMVEKLSKGEKIPIYGTGLNVREWIHVSDHSQAILNVIHNGGAGEIYNIGSGNELSNLAVARKVLEIMGQTDDMIAFVQDRKGHDLRYRVDFTKLSKLGHKNAVDWESGIVSYVNWHLSNKNHWNKGD
jgi:dTDP-glucose 4,6-dehydratase